MITIKGNPLIQEMIDETEAVSLSALAASVVQSAAEKGKLIGTAESCTGGLIAAAITEVPGASDVFVGSVVSYSNSVKCGLLGVSEQTLATVGAVSEDTAKQMAFGAVRALGADICVSVTGIAGPGGAVPGKPVGTVWIGCSAGAESFARLYRFDGDRDIVRKQTVKEALSVILRELQKC